MYYRRTHIPGVSYFFTVNLADRKSSLLTDNVGVLRDVIRKVKQEHPFKIEAMVVLPEHLHAVWRLPEGDSDYSKRWMLVKSGFSRALPKTEHIRMTRIKKRERGIWQRRYWEHMIRDELDWERHVNYIHYNPVKHGWVEHVIDWPYSSFHRYVRMGWLPPDWGGGYKVVDVGWGEVV